MNKPVFIQLSGVYDNPIILNITLIESISVVLEMATEVRTASGDTFRVNEPVTKIWDAIHQALGHIS